MKLPTVGLAELKSRCFRLMTCIACELRPLIPLVIMWALEKLGG